MKRHLFILSILSMLVLAALALASQAPAQKLPTDRPVPPSPQQVTAEQLEIQKAFVEFTEPVKLLGAILKGSYLFLHDEGKMSRGEPCTWVYARGETGKFDKLVTSFHCIPEQRDKPADRFQVIIIGVATPFTLPEVVEYRFAGSTEGHQVPKAE